MIDTVKATTVIGTLSELVEDSTSAKIVMDNKPRVKVARLSDKALLPHQGTSASAGFDLHSTERVDVPAGCSVLVGTGLKMEIPVNWCGQINPRSGLASKHKIVVGARVIDADYRGEVKINIINHGSDTFEIKEGDRIAQILFLPVLTRLVEVSVDDIDDNTDRGAGGFGSTGILAKGE